MEKEKNLLECKDELATFQNVDEIENINDNEQDLENINDNEQDIEYENDNEQDLEYDYEELNESPNAREERIKSYGEKIPKDNEILTIIKTSYTNIKNKDENGNLILPKKALNSDTYYYPIKLKVLFKDKEGNRIVEYYPGVKVWSNKECNLNKNRKGKIVPTISRPNVSDSAVANLFKLYAKFINKNINDISDKEFREGLIGKKVKVKVIKGKFAGKEWFRNDIVEFIK